MADKKPDKPKKPAKTLDQMIEDATKVLIEKITKKAESEGKSANQLIVGSLTKVAIKTFEGGKATLDDKKIGDNVALFARIQKPTNEDYRKILLQLLPKFIDLQAEADKKAKEEEAKAGKEAKPKGDAKPSSEETEKSDAS